MDYTITNGTLTVSAETLGAQLKEIRGAGGAQYLWPGQADIWGDRAPVLFPYVARLTGGKYTYRGNSYSLPIHGFASGAEFACEKTEDQLRFTLCDTPETRACYPFPFRFTVAYRLAGNTLTQEYTVENTGEETMWFGLGAHPGFRVPLEEGLDFTDYCLEFVPEVSPVRVGFTPQCFLSGEDTPYPLEHGRLPLRHDLFDQDAIVLRDCGSQVTLRSAKGKRAVKAEFAGIPFLGIWHQPNMAAPYVCIEPWCSLPSRQDVVEDLETQPTLLSLPARERYVASVRFTFQ